VISAGTQPPDATPIGRPSWDDTARPTRLRRRATGGIVGRLFDGRIRVDR
jgi:hypothetical protein